VNLIADIGNTRSKLAIYHDDILVNNQSYNKTIGSAEYEQFINSHKPINNLIYSAVGKLGFNPSSVNISGQCIELSHRTKLPIELLYSSKSTLGTDRIAAAVGGSVKINNNDVLIIDAGSCITFDFVNSNKQYLGGSISPGLKMRFQALNTFTENLPLLTNNKLTAAELIGNTTDKSIISGILNGTIEEVIGLSDKYHKKFDALNIVLTGGDCHLFEKALRRHFLSKKNMIFADSNLVLTGLNEILNFNVN